MNTYAATLPRLRVREHLGTGGQWFRDNIWRRCLYFVRRSNAWPHPTLEGHIWQSRNPVPEEDS